MYHTDIEYAFFCNENVPYEICNMGEIPLRYPSGDYVLYAPLPHAWYEWGEQAYDLLIPTKTNIKLGVVTTVKRVQELTGDELNEIAQYWAPRHCAEYDYSIDIDARDDYIQRTLIPEWNSRHAKPRKTADGKGYECFPYDDSRYKDIMDFYGICKSYMPEDGISGFEYKGLPLKRYANPWLELNEWRKGVMG